MMRSTGAALVMAVVGCAPAVGPSTSSGADAPVSADSSAVAAAVQRYVVGWRDGDLEALSEVLDPSWRVYWSADEDGRQVVRDMTVDELVARGSRPNPSYGLDTRIERLRVLDGAVAYADVSISRSGGSYLDHLVFYRKPDGWKMVIKTFVVRNE